MSFGADRGTGAGLRDPLGVLRSDIDVLVDQDPSERPLSEKGTYLIRLRHQIDRLEAEFAACALDAHRNGVGLEDGHASTPAWIAWKCGMRRGAVSKVLRNAELVELLPETGTAWRDGKIATTAVELIANARVDGHDEKLVAVETEFLDFARRGDHNGLRMVTDHFKACARADGSRPAPPDQFRIAYVGDRAIGRFDVAKSDGQTIADTVEKFTRPPAANDETTLAQRQAEGLVRICEVALERGTDAPGARPVVSYLTHERTADDVAHPLTLGLFSGVLDPRERDRILCDATIVPVTTDGHGNPLGVGRATPVWNRAQRRAVTARSPHCRWPGCEIPAPWCDIHHVVSWEHGGPTDVINAEHLCRRHHTFLHAHPDWTVTFDHQQFRVYRADGTEVFADAWHELAV